MLVFYLFTGSFWVNLCQDETLPFHRIPIRKSVDGAMQIHYT